MMKWELYLCGGACVLGGGSGCIIRIMVLGGGASCIIGRGSCYLLV